MKVIRLISLIGFGAGLTTLSPAQVSTFPSPPPLTPPPETAADLSTNSVSSPATPETATPSPSPADAAKTTTPAPDAAAKPPAPAPVSAATLSSMAALDDKVGLEAGDTISFRVIEDRDEAVARIVTDTGEVDFPYVGRIKVEGKTCHQVAVQLKQLLEVNYYKHATVIVGLDLIIGQTKEKPRDLVWVVGEVRSVGPQDLVKGQPMTVSQIILRAGGFGDFADQRKVKLVHRDKTAAGSAAQAPTVLDPKDVQVVDVKAVFDGHSDVDPVIKPNDYVIVPKRVFNW